MPEGLKEIGAAAFCACESLEEIVIPKSVSFLGYDLFYGNKNLKKITIKDKNNLPKGFEMNFDKFNFKTILMKDNEMTFVKNQENNRSEENE